MKTPTDDVYVTPEGLFAALSNIVEAVAARVNWRWNGRRVGGPDALALRYWQIDAVRLMRTSLAMRGSQVAHDLATVPLAYQATPRMSALITEPGFWMAIIFDAGHRLEYEALITRSAYAGTLFLATGDRVNQICQFINFLS